MMEWQPIETAPKDGTRILLYRPSYFDWARVIGGNWCDEKIAKKPRPYWTHDRECLIGVLEARQHQPTHWMPLPPPPAVA
jgi:hypothetical protein